MKHLFEVLTFVSSLVCLASGKTYLHSPDLFYECIDNNEIVITENNATAYGSLYAIGTHVNGSQNWSCNVDRQNSADSTTINFTITTCNVSSLIKVFVMRENQQTNENIVLGGEGVNVYGLKCTDTRKGGTNVNKTLVVNAGYEQTIDEHFQKAADLSMEITWGNQTQVPSSSTVLIGAKLSIVISANIGHTITAKSCIAKETSNLNRTKNLIHDGITEDPFLISSFTSMKNISNNIDRVEIDATLYAFHFRDSDKITIECTITVCEDDDDSCPIKNGHGRKRRAVTMEPYSKVLQSTLRVLDSNHNDDGLEKSGAAHDSKPWLYSLTFCILFAIA